jgi:hypothetical protein
MSSNPQAFKTEHKENFEKREAYITFISNLWDIKKEHRHIVYFSFFRDNPNTVNTANGVSRRLVITKAKILPQVSFCWI